jgi:hypothetical protein
MRLGVISGPDDRYSLEETARRRDEAICRALNTPPKPNEGTHRQERARQGRKGVESIKLLNECDGKRRLARPNSSLSRPR